MDIFLIILIILILIILFSRRKEHGLGAITQLVAKGPQDQYLTVGNEKYLWYYHPYYWMLPHRKHWYNSLTPFPWNNPTRVQNLYYPTYLPFFN